MTGLNGIMDFLPVAGELAWPIAVAIAWISGEFGHRITGLPHISIYGLTGFLLGQIGLSGQSGMGAVVLLASLSMFTSPAAILRIVNELRSSCCTEMISSAIILRVWSILASSRA